MDRGNYFDSRVPVPEALLLTTLPILSQFSLVAQSCPTLCDPWTAACQASLSITNSQFSSVQLLSRVRLFTTPWTAACQVSLSITNSKSLFKFMSIESVMPSNHLILYCLLLLLSSSFPTIRSFLRSQFFTSIG